MPAMNDRPTAETGSNMAFGEHLRRHRLAARMTQEELAEASGISVRSISDLERGARTTPQAAPAGQLADALGLSGAARDAWFAVIRSQRLPRGRAAVAIAALAAAPLPIFAAPILGREREIAGVEDLLGSERIVTLIGPGGVGKTRLAAAVAAQAQDARPGAVVWVALDGLSSPAAVLPALARACGAGEGGAHPISRIAEALAGRAMLAVLDNAEHVLEAAADLPALLKAAPGLTLLVTSREELRIAGERVLPIEPLPLPQKTASIGRIAANPAVALYLRAVGNPADASSQDVIALQEAAAVARLLDGLPLALELAGAQAAHLPRQTIAGLLEAAGLAALARGRRDGPGRFRTMEAAIAWSLALLPPDAERLLRMLGVFQGGFTTEAVANIAASLGAPGLIRLLPALINAQLIQHQHDGPGGRFRLLEPIRMFALALLRASGGLQAARDAHATWFLGWARRQLPVLDGPAPLPALDAIERDLPNLHAAMAHAYASGDALAALPVITGLHRFYDSRGYRSEHRIMLETAIAATAGAENPAVLEALFWAAYHANILGDEPAASAGIARLRAFAAESGDPEWTARADLLQWGRDAGSAAARDNGEALLRHGLSALGERRTGFIAGALSLLLGVELQERGDAAAALPLLENARDSAAAAGRALDLPVPLARLGLALLDLGRDDEALPCFTQALDISRTLGLPGVAFFPLLGLAMAGARSGDPVRQETAAAALAAAEEIVRGQGLAWGPYWETTVAHLEETLSGLLGPDRLAALRDASREGALLDIPGLSGATLR